MNRLLVAWALCIGLLGAGENGYAHEMGTSALIVHEGTPGTGQFVFKRTVGSDDKIPPIDFQFAPVVTFYNRYDTDPKIRSISPAKQHQVVDLDF